MASLFKRTFKRRDPTTGVTVRRKTPKWYGQFRDASGRLHRVPLCTDKAAAQAMLHQLIVRSERRHAGLPDPDDKALRRPIDEHVDDYRRHLLAKADTL